jgi:hypothetical protein
VTCEYVVTIQGAPAQKPSRALSRNRKDQLRFGGGLVGALLLHALVSIFRVHPAPARGATTLQAARDPIFVALEEAATGVGISPGGGSEQPVPEAKKASAPAQTIAPKHAAARVRVGPLNERPQVNESSAESDDPGLSSDVLASALGAEALPTRPRALRRVLLSSTEAGSRAAPEAALQKASDSRDEGSGYGRNGGPGGQGRGLIRERFAFGGPSGAFRADVCFIERVRTLKEVVSCPPRATFFTDVLNVPPRRFNDGFPGISDRNEWFAIQYRGKFKVESADYYTFRLLSDDGAILKIDGYPIIDNDGQHLPQSKRMTITLEAGEHDFYLFYYQGPADFMALQLFVTPFNGQERLFGPRL